MPFPSPAHRLADTIARQMRTNSVNLPVELREPFAQGQREVLRRFRKTADIFEPSIQPICAYTAEGEPAFEGTGMLARLGRRYYLVTAAHVLDACSHGLTIGSLIHTGNPLEGASVVTKPPAGKSRAHDRFDIGFVRLTRKEVNTVGTDAFFDLNNTADQDWPEPVLLTMAIGFPVRDQSVDETSFQSQLTTYMAGIEPWQSYRQAGISPRTHILLTYRRERIQYNGKTFGSPPSMRGMSGGGVWPVPFSWEPSRRRRPPLLGMITERPKAFGPSVLLTRGAGIRYFIRRADSQ